jgi:hypothetical protein
METKSRKLLTFSLTGIAAYMLADFFHEVIGHSGGCLIIGQHIDLITSAFFRSSPGSYITDLSGPLVNLILGSLIFILLNREKNLFPVYRFLLLLTMSYNLFWFSGTILHSSFSKRGDWTYFISQMNIGTLSKPLLVVAGIGTYYFSIRLISKQIQLFSFKFPEFPLRKAIHYSYIAAAVAAMIAGLFFAPDRINAAKEGLLEMIGSLPILFIKIGQTEETENIKLGNYTTLNLTICAVFILFCFTLGHGLFYK